MPTSSWPARLTQAYPAARVVGRLADQPGYLLKLKTRAMDTAQLGQLQDALVRLGCTGWHWQHDAGVMTVRAYVPHARRSRGARALVAALVVALVVCAWYLLDDVRIAALAGR